MRGKYSPSLPNRNKGYETFKYNARKEIPPTYHPETMNYDEEIHFGNYDEDGYDSYGYSAYLEDGRFVGAGNGIDRLGYTENDYLSSFTDEEMEDL